ncbi:MAG: flagellar basal body rod protein FlgB [Burkholderiaceae bacterium]
MLDRLTSNIEKHGATLTVRAQRQQVLSTNLANADTPGFKARDIDFKSELAAVTEAGSASRLKTTRTDQVRITDPRHIGGALSSDGPGSLLTTLKFRQNEQASLDNNTVNLDRERANFAENSLRYEASLRFIDGSARKMISAIRGE